jgi:hypothetical protein
MYKAAADCKDISRAPVPNWEPHGVTLAEQCSPYVTMFCSGWQPVQNRTTNTPLFCSVFCYKCGRKVKLSLHLSKHHSLGECSSISDLDTTSGRVGHFTPEERAPVSPLNWRQDGPHSRSGRCGGKQNLLIIHSSIHSQLIYSLILKCVYKHSPNYTISRYAVSDLRNLRK